MTPEVEFFPPWGNDCRAKILHEKATPESFCGKPLVPESYIRGIVFVVVVFCRSSILVREINSAVHLWWAVLYVCYTGSLSQKGQEQ